MSFLDGLFAQGAQSLKTPSDTIDVSSSEPALNRVLKVTSMDPPRATWAPEDAGVATVFGRTGAVVAEAGDYSSNAVDNDSIVPGATVTDALETLSASIPAPAPVSSVFGRTGVVAAVSGDYQASKVSNDSSVAGSTTKDALQTLAAADGTTIKSTAPSAATLTVGSIPDLTLAARSGTGFVGVLPASFAHKAAPTASDVVMFSDAAASNAIKQATLAEVLSLLPSFGIATGNPFIDAPTTPDAWNDEFNSGSADLAVRGWTVYNHSDSVTMTRVGGIVGGAAAALASNEYRSSRFGSTLIIQVPTGKLVHILKAVTGSYLFAARVGNPMAANGGLGGLFLTTAASPPYLTAAHNSGAGPGWAWCYIDAPPTQRYLGRTINAATFVDINVSANVNFAFTEDTFLINHDESTPAQFGSFVNAGSMQVRGTSVGGTNGSAIMATPVAMAGVTIYQGLSSSVAGGAGFHHIDYIRRMPVGTWPGTS